MFITPYFFIGQKCLMYLFIFLDFIENIIMVLFRY